jgi:hypothetical protein
MDALSRAIQQAEKPGRLQLAIIEWQRQLTAKQEARRGETVIHGRERERTALTA